MPPVALLAMRPRVALRVLRPEPEDARPHSTSDCKVCDWCQRYRDSFPRDPWHLKHCGHNPEEALLRSRPCVFVGCAHNTFLDVKKNGKIQYNRYGMEPDECEDSCSLDRAAEGDASQAEVAVVMGISQQGVKQIEVRALRKIRKQRKGLQR